MSSGRQMSMRRARALSAQQPPGPPPLPADGQIVDAIVTLPEWVQQASRGSNIRTPVGRRCLRELVEGVWKAMAPK